MKAKRLIFSFTVVTSLVAAHAQPASDAVSAYSLPLTLKSAGAGSGGDEEDDEKAKAADLVKKSLNPLASMISVPFQNNWDFSSS